MTKSDKRTTIGPPKGSVASWVSDALSADENEAFWRRVTTHETAPLTTDFQQLLDAGVELPDPDSLDAEQLTAKLWEVIRALAELDVFLEFTDHLSDRELYEKLWRDLLRTEREDLADGGVWHVDASSSGGDEGAYVYLKYYADARDRELWLADFPDDDMPPHEDPPYDRDRHLPKPRGG
jgi:hypothetical protein